MLSFWQHLIVLAISSSQRGQGFPDVRKKVKDKLRQNLNRMILYQLREGKDYPEITFEPE